MTGYISFPRPKKKKIKRDNLKAGAGLCGRPETESSLAGITVGGGVGAVGNGTTSQGDGWSSPLASCSPS